MHPRFKDFMNFFRYLSVQIRRHSLFNLASTLAFTSLLAFVPLFTVIFAYVSHIPWIQDRAVEVNHVILTYFIPDVGADVEGLMKGFIENALSMQVWGLVTLVITALMLIATIDKAIHKIWHDARKRSALGSLLVYWLVLIISPLALALSLAITSYVSALSWVASMPSEASLLWTLILPWLSSTIGLTLLYWTIPSSPVKFINAFVGAMTAALLFELSKRLFGLYIYHFPLQEAIFGALAAFPLILIWLFVAWLVILLGAELCYAMGLSRQERINVFSESRRRAF